MEVGIKIDADGYVISSSSGTLKLTGYENKSQGFYHRNYIWTTVYNTHDIIYLKKDSRGKRFTIKATGRFYLIIGGYGIINKIVYVTFSRNIGPATGGIGGGGGGEW